jgi:hypothetical protein
MIGYIQVNDLTIRELHSDEDVESINPNRVLYKEVTGPHGLELVLQSLARLENLWVPTAFRPCISGPSSRGGEHQT